jgi:hypothetical protein
MIRALLLCALLGACESSAPAEAPAPATIGELACATCKQNGRCTLTAHGCIAGSLADCLRSQVCVEQGWCDLDDGQCVAKKVIP